VRRAAAVVVALLLTGCGGGAEDDDAAAGSAAESAAGAESASGAAADGNPVVDEDFPDPDVLQVDGTYYAYATNTATLNVQVATSTDLDTWEVSDTDALPALPSWVIPGKTWAPEVTQFGPDRFVMYTTTTNFDPTYQCIAVATATSPEGPFEVVGDGMLVCPADEGGAIDASTFTDDDGSRYLVWKNDGNCCSIPTRFYLQELSDDGLELVGEVTELGIRNDRSWEGAVIEAPTLLERDGTYYLFYSGGNFASAGYSVGYATSDSLRGPYEDS